MSKSADFKQFIFKNSFDGKGSSLAAEKQEDRPQFSSDELQAAKDAAYASGYDQGFREGKGEAAQIVANVQTKACDQIIKLLENPHYTADMYYHIMVDAVKKLMPSLEALQSSQEIELFIKHFWQDLLEEKNITITVSPELLEHPLWNELKWPNTLKIVLVSDENLGPSDIFVKWDHSRLERSISNSLKELEYKLTSHIIKAETQETQAPVDLKSQGQESITKE